MSDAAQNVVQGLVAGEGKIGLDAGLAVDFTAQIHKLVQGHVVVKLNAVLLQQRLVVQKRRRIDVGAYSVDPAIHGGAGYNTRRKLAQINGAILHIGGDVGQQTLLHVLGHVGIVHQDDVRQGMTGGCCGQLVPVIIPGYKLPFNGNALMRFGIAVQDGGIGFQLIGLLFSDLRSMFQPAEKGQPVWR